MDADFLSSRTSNLFADHGITGLDWPAISPVRMGLVKILTVLFVTSLSEKM